MEWDYDFKSLLCFFSTMFQPFWADLCRGLDRMIFYVWDTYHIICVIHGLSIPLSH